MITIIGLGTRAGELSLRAAECLKGAASVLVRAASLASAETLKELGIPFESLDFVYEKSRNFDTLAKNLAAEVRKRAAEGDVVYCVDGGVTEDRAAQLLIKQGGVTVLEVSWIEIPEGQAFTAPFGVNVPGQPLKGGV